MDFSFTDEQRSIAETFDRFCDKELNYDYVRWMDENADFPPDELWAKFADLGLFAATVPVEYGGQGFGLLDSMIAHEQICKRSMSVALAVGSDDRLRHPLPRRARHGGAKAALPAPACGRPAAHGDGPHRARWGH